MSSSKTVTLFIQCLVDTIYPEVAQAMVQVFRRLGIALTCPTDQTCCGQPAFNSGYRQSARVAAKHFIEVFAGAEQIVCPSGSCVNMVRHHYVELFHNDSRWLQKAQNLAGRIYEFSEYLVDVLGVEDLGVRFDGAFSVKYPDISNAMVSDKVKNIIDTGAGVVVGCDMGCLMNIEGKLSRMGSSIKVMHLAQILAG